MSIHWSLLPANGQIFTHCSKDESGKTKYTTFAVTSLRSACDLKAALGHSEHIAHIPITEEFAILIMKHRGIERPRLRRAKRTKEYYPFLHLAMPDGTHLLVDGSHTYVARWMKGHREALSYIVPEFIWSQYIVEGLPDPESEEALLKSFSGDPANV